MVDKDDKVSPGQSVFFKAKVTLVREEEQEYDVEFENGTVLTLKGKDVYKADSKVMKKAPARARSKSMGRGRAKAKEVLDAPAAAEPAEKTEEAKSEAAVDENPKVAPTPKPKTEKPLVTPSRVSSRLAGKAVTDAISDNEGEAKVKLAPNPELPDARRKKKSWSFEWIWALVFMVLGQQGDDTKVKGDAGNPAQDREEGMAAVDTLRWIVAALWTSIAILAINSVIFYKNLEIHEKVRYQK